MDPIFDPRSGKMVDPQTGLPVTGNYKPPARVSTFDQMFNGTGIPERINAGHSLFNPVVALGESGQHTQNMLSPGRAPWERVSDLGKAMTGMAGTVAPMMMAARGALPTTNAMVDALTGINMPGGEFLADEFGGVKMPGQGGITAYHGSPHSFDKFSMDKIGTGEGAQAYGHGLYFAEREGIAKSYRDTLGVKEDAAKWLERATRENPEAVNLVRRDLAAKIGFEPSDNLIRDIVEGTIQGAPSQHLSLDALDAIQKVPTIAPTREGSMYEVRINANPDDFLDWDKPLSEQAEVVRKFAGGASVDAAKGPTKAKLRAFQGGAENPELGVVATGQDLHRALSDYGGDGAAARSALREAGIPGIKYLDAGSRGAGDGSRNYVVFDENLIEIVKKYGIAGAAAMLGMSAADLETRMGVPKMTPGGLGVGG